MLYARLSAKHIVTFILIFIPGSKHWHHLPCYTDEERGDRELKSPAWGTTATGGGARGQLGSLNTKQVLLTSGRWGGNICGLELGREGRSLP